MREVLQFQPIYQERVWGGRGLNSFLGRSIPPGPPIGESWEIADRPQAQSIVAGGPFDGISLRRMIERKAADLMGPKWPPSRPFPILVKWLDCTERLSLQVHPPASAATAPGCEPKTENWYVAHSAPGAFLFVGLKPGVTRETLAKALAAGTAEQCVNRVRVSAGDSVLVRSGQVHAIDAGNFILEVQQNSDTTFRLYDWGRLGLDGSPRKLHVEESLRSIQWGATAPEIVRAAPTSGVIASCDEFSIRRVVLGRGDSLAFKSREQPRILSVTAGALTVCDGSSGARPVPLGANVLLPWSAEAAFVARKPAIVLVTEDFA